MPFDLVAYSESQDSAILTNIAALADPHATVSGDNITIAEGYDNIAMVYALGPNLTQVKVTTPSLAGRIAQNIMPLDLGEEPASPVPFADFHLSPLKLKVGEDMTAQMSEGGAGATRGTVLVWLSNGPLASVESSDIFTIRATNTTTLSANAWTNGALTLDDNLEAGKYQLVGARAESAGLQAARFVFRAQGNRPGMIGFDADSDIMPDIFRRGRLGVWGEFTNQTIPTVDFLSNSADTSQTVWLDLKKTG